MELAKRANSGVHNVDAPALVLVGNKLPGEECELDVRKVCTLPILLEIAQIDTVSCFAGYCPVFRGVGR